MAQIVSPPTMAGIPYPAPPKAGKNGNNLHTLDVNFDPIDLTVKLEPALPEPLKFRLGDQVVSGHLASDPQHARYPSARYDLRTYMQADNGQAAEINFSELLAASKIPPYPSQCYNVTQDQIEHAARETGREREEQLQDLRKLHDGHRVVPKDGSLNPEDVSMFLRSSNDVSTRYVQQLSQIGKVEGFHMVAGVTSGTASDFDAQLRKGGYDNISLLEMPRGEVWVEDYGEPVLGGGRVTPAIFDDSWGSFIKEAISEGRQERYAREGLDGAFAYHGAVNQGKFQSVALAQGIAAQGFLRQALSYLEGGNIMTGSLTNGDGYVLVGKDSFQVTRKLLEHQTGRTFEPEDVRKVIAADLGLKPENVHPIEQPGAFHLDMRLTPIGPGEIMLNDSVAAAKQEIAWLKDDLAKQNLTGNALARKERDLEEQAGAMLEHARLMARYEAMTERDLQAAGLTVHRVGGSFVSPENPGRDTANYFNARHGTNEQGERFTILMGGTPREEAYMAQQLFDASGGQVNRIHFLDPKVTQQTLDLMGGLKCRTKPGGDLVSVDGWQHPHQAHLQPA